MCTIQNLYRRVFSFRSRALPLEISSRDWSLNILRSGLWSTVMMRLLQPRTKNRALSRASATARGSPSIGVQSDLAGWVNQPQQVQSSSQLGSRRAFWMHTGNAFGKAKIQYHSLTNLWPSRLVWICRICGHLFRSHLQLLPWIQVVLGGMDCVCDGFHVWHDGSIPRSPLCDRVCHFSWHILPSSGTMSLALLLARALGLLVIHHGQGQPSHLPASGVGQVLGCDGQQAPHQGQS